MDPKEALEMVQGALDDGEYDVASEYLGYYWEWRGKGGFEPEGGDRMANALARRLNKEWTPDELAWDGNPKVILLRGKDLEPVVREERTRALARLRAKALAELHSTDYEETDEGFVVDASEYYDPPARGGARTRGNPNRKRKTSKSLDAKAILRRAMRGT
jgi:hypothetical protein